MQSMKDAAANAGASAKAGMEKAKASMQEKVDKMKTRDPNEKEMARERKEERKENAELMKQEARHQNATARQAGVGYNTTAGGHNRGDDVNRGYPTATTTPSSGYDVGRQADAGDPAGGYAYNSTTGSQDFPSGGYDNRNWEEREPKNAAAGTRRNTRADDDPFHGSY